MKDTDAEKKLLEFILENKEKFYKMIYFYIKNEDFVMEVYQESITKALSNIEKLKHEEYIKTWFYRIVINESLQKIRKNKRITAEVYNEELPYEEKDISSVIDLYKSIDKLNFKLRTVIMLRFFEDKTLEEISQILNININTVKSRLYKALKILKLDLDKGNENE